MDSSTLQAAGLSTQAAQLYLAALATGTVSVQKLAQHAKLKRPTAYNYIAQLVEDGWLEKIPVGKKEYYRAVDPKQFEQHLQKQLSALQQSLPKLSQLYSQHAAQPAVSVFEGNRAIEQLHSSIAQANSIRFWSNLADFERLFPDAADDLSRAISQKQINAREIIINTAEAKRAAKRYASIAGKHYACRVAGKGMVHNNSVVFGHTVLLFRLQQHNLAVIRIDDSSIAETFKTIFDLAWESAARFIPR